jgi:hypothetical protein
LLILAFVGESFINAMKHEVPDLDPERQVSHGKIQMLGAAGLFEVGMNVPDVVWGGAALLSSAILVIYGVKDYLVGSYRQEQ